MADSFGFKEADIPKISFELLIEILGYQMTILEILLEGKSEEEKEKLSKIINDIVYQRRVDILKRLHKKHG